MTDKKPGPVKQVGGEFSPESFHLPSLDRLAHAAIEFNSAVMGCVRDAAADMLTHLFTFECHPALDFVSEADEPTVGSEKDPLMLRLRVPLGMGAENDPEFEFSVRDALAFMVHSCHERGENMDKLQQISRELVALAMEIDSVVAERRSVAPVTARGVH